MLKKIEVKESGDSNLLPGEVIDRLKFEEINEKLIFSDLRHPQKICFSPNCFFNLLGLAKRRTGGWNFDSA